VNAKTPLSKSADLPHVRHNRFFFEDGNVTFLVSPPSRAYRINIDVLLDVGNLRGSGAYSIASIGTYSGRHSNELKDRLSRLPDEEGPRSPQLFL